MRLDLRSYELRAVNRTYQPHWLERRAVRWTGFALIWATTVGVCVRAWT